MPHSRFYLDAPLEEKIVYLEGTEFHHLYRVMRKQVGDEIELVNGRHLLALAKITALQKSSGTLTLLKVEKKAPLLLPLVLIQGLPKLPLLELILQKGTELGVSTFYLYPAMRSDKKTFSQTQKTRIEQIVIGAMKQCGRLDLPSIKWGLPNLFSTLKQADKNQKRGALPLESFGNIYFGDLRENVPPLSQIGALPATLIIGPEKGFTPSEVETFETIAQGVSLNPYTLRTETAALAGLAILAGKSTGT